ncbi:hypothetical protein FOVG_16755 [Fusarium oxysporum f. sp. pisi HDV247]|uniref:Uncharacterized protein n=1 Tax=Fusarium oxysporum f. sp. pisi HDV247 TaxID=1080344 RepID=W9NGV3_FUSOX|nr:hypothetical protein FOVG_16755 [Fusarium oxysporum f. sp. pisi HDV247]
MRRVNLDGTLTNPMYDLCYLPVPDDKAIYVALKDHIKQLQPLGGKKEAKWKNSKKNDKGAIMDAIESLPYGEDIQKLSTSYDSNVVCASVKVLVNNDSSNLRSLLSSSVENSEPEEVADEDVVWDAEPKPIIQEAPPYNYPCDDEFAAEDYKGTKDVARGNRRGLYEGETLRRRR